MVHHNITSDQALGGALEAHRLCKPERSPKLPSRSVFSDPGPGGDIRLALVEFNNAVAYYADTFLGADGRRAGIILLDGQKKPIAHVSLLQDFQKTDEPLAHPIPVGQLMKLGVARLTDNLKSAGGSLQISHRGKPYLLVQALFEIPKADPSVPENAPQ